MPLRLTFEAHPAKCNANEMGDPNDPLIFARSLSYVHLAYCYSYNSYLSDEEMSCNGLGLLK